MELLKFIHDNFSIQVSNNSRKIFTDVGVPQGFMTSPSLFSIFTESLLSDLDNLKLTNQIKELLAIMYADDLCLVIRN
jgi:hypothetical protein